MGNRIIIILDINKDFSFEEPILVEGTGNQYKEKDMTNV